MSLEQVAYPSTPHVIDVGSRVELKVEHDGAGLLPRILNMLRDSEAVCGVSFTVFLFKQPFQNLAGVSSVPSPIAHARRHSGDHRWDGEGPILAMPWAIPFVNAALAHCLLGKVGPSPASVLRSILASMLSSSFNYFHHKLAYHHARTHIIEHRVSDGLVRARCILRPPGVRCGNRLHQIVL